MTDPECKKIYIPTEAEVDAIGGFDPASQLVEYYGAAERLRIGYLATQNETYNTMVAGPMQYASSDRLSALGSQVIEMLNTNFEQDWDGAYITIRALDNARIMSKAGLSNSTPYPKKEYLATQAQLRFRGEGYRAFNNYHDPDEYTLQPLNQLKFYAYDNGEYVMHVPVVHHESGEPRVHVRFIPQKPQGSRVW